MRENPTPRQNRLLAGLSAATLERLLPHLELVSLSQGDVLYDSNCRLHHVYFPITVIVSKLLTTASGACAEFAVVGNEGIIGVALVMGGETVTNQAVVVSAGHAYRLKGQILQEEFTRAGSMQHLLLRYAQALLTQVAQTAVCNRHHSIRQQLSRWLLLILDRSSSSSFVMTQELIASMLGVRREGITEAAAKLQRAGLIHYSRGKITVLDRAGIQAQACECYAVVKRESDRLLPDMVASRVVAASAATQRHPARMSTHTNGIKSRSIVDVSGSVVGASMTLGLLQD